MLLVVLLSILRTIVEYNKDDRNNLEEQNGNLEANTLQSNVVF